MYEYIHGGSMDSHLRLFNIKKDQEIIDFSVNINPFGTPPILKIEWNNLIKYVDRYPTQDGDGVLEFYEEKFSINKDCIAATNGSIELIYLAPRALNIKTAAVVEPSFYDYRRAFEINGCEIISINTNKENGFRFELDKKTVDAIENADAVILGNPNNPTGSLIDKNIITELAENYKDKWFLIDEAFIQFTDNYQDHTLMGCGITNIVVFHSLTKFYALPGLRIGAAVGSKEAVDNFKKFKEPWSVNIIAEHAAKSIIQCSEYEKSTIKLIQKERTRFKQNISNTKQIKLFDTHANFFLAELNSTYDMDDFLKYLLLNGVYVRDCRNFRGLFGNFFRFAILTEKENDKLMNLFSDYV